MKKLFMFMLTLPLALLMCTCSYMEEPPPPDLIPDIVSAAVSGDAERGRAAAEERNSYIDQGLISGNRLSYDELYLLAQFVLSMSGDNWVTEEYRLCTAEVVMNRVASPEYPDTIEKVIFQSGQYGCIDRETVESLSPPKSCILAALRVLLGQRMLEPQVVIQSSVREGSVYATFCDNILGYTYFCESPNVKLYAALEAARAKQ